MEFILDNWYWMLCIVVFVCGGTISVVRFCKLAADVRKEKILGWLLQAVLWAEKEFGSGTGRLKLSAVYDKFCERFTWVSRILTFQKFSQLVDDALAQMRELLKENRAIAAVVAEKEVGADD